MFYAEVGGTEDIRVVIYRYLYIWADGGHFDDAPTTNQTF